MSTTRESLGLPAGSIVADYRLEGVHAAWGFCLVYDAVDTISGEPVAVHELLPEELVDRPDGWAVIGRSQDAEEKLAWAAERFLREGQDLAECAHPALPRMIEAFAANGTAYWVTPREEARNLKTWLQQLGRPPTEAELERLIVPLLAGLERAHASGLLHLNLKLETIQLTPEGRPRLIRFAGARQAIARYGHQAGAVTTGYSPAEQYQVEKAEGPWTDIYSLAAVLHRAISGQAPPDAGLRAGRDSYQPLLGRYSASYRTEFLAAIDEALALEPADRPQTIADWRTMLGFREGKDSVRSPLPLLAGAGALLFVLGVAAWFLFPRSPRPDDLLKDKIALTEEQKQAAIEQDKEEKKLQAEAEKQADEEAKKREEEQKEKARQMADSKTDPEKMAAEKEAAAKAEEEKQSAEKAARLAQEAADAAAKAEAAKRAAADAARTAPADDPAKKEALEKAAAQAAAEAARLKQEAAEAARLAAGTRSPQEKSGEAKKVTEEEAAKMAAAIEVAKRQAAAIAAQQAQAETEKRAAQQQQGMTAERAVAEKAAAEKMAAEKAAAEKMAAEKMAAEKMAAEKMAAEKMAAEKMAAEKMAAEKMAAEKMAAEKMAAAEKAAAEKAVAAKAEAEKVAMQQKKGDPNQGKYKTTGVEGGNADDEGKKPGKTSSGGSAVSGIPGVWETTATDAQGKARRRLVIYDDGRYLISDNENWKDTGAILANAGRIQMRSDATGAIVRSSFKLRSLSKIVTSGALGDDEWQRVSASPGKDPNPPKP